MARLARRVKDKRVLRLIRRYLQAGMMAGGLVSPRTEGTPQGGPLSPLLSNVLLDEMEGSVATFGITCESPLGGPRYTANPHTLWISRV